MAHYDVSRACGCEERPDITGPHVERQRRLEWLAQTDCSTHYHEKLAAAAATKAAATGMPDLTGSENQVSWALTIRAAADTDLRDLRERCPNANEVAALDAAMVEFYAGHLEARWWIDHRSESVRPYITPILHRLQGR